MKRLNGYCNVRDLSAGGNKTKVLEFASSFAGMWPEKLSWLRYNVTDSKILAQQFAEVQTIVSVGCGTGFFELGMVSMIGENQRIVGIEARSYLTQTDIDPFVERIFIEDNPSVMASLGEVGLLFVFAHRDDYFQSYMNDPNVKVVVVVCGHGGNCVDRFVIRDNSYTFGEWNITAEYEGNEMMFCTYTRA